MQDKSTLEKATLGCSHAFYLVHSMYEGGRLAELDRTGAANFASVASKSGIQRTVYLGGLGRGKQSTSEHLKSRDEVDEILRSEGVPVTTLRAAMIIGAGSASFEVMRSLVERLPVMVTPLHFLQSA